MKEELKEGVSSSESVTGPTSGWERRGWERQEQEGCRLSTSLLRCFTAGQKLQLKQGSSLRFLKKPELCSLLMMQTGEY